jgi:hypothetical protein
MFQPWLTRWCVRYGQADEIMARASSGVVSVNMYIGFKRIIQLFCVKN